MVITVVAGLIDIQRAVQIPSSHFEQIESNVLFFMNNNLLWYCRNAVRYLLDPIIVNCLEYCQVNNLLNIVYNEKTR